MYIEKVSIENIRCIHKLELDFKDIPKAGWHVILGDNGVGKSSLLRAIVFTLLGRDFYSRVEYSPETWLNSKSSNGFIETTILYDKDFDQSSKLGKNQPNQISCQLALALNKTNGYVEPSFLSKNRNTQKYRENGPALSYNWGRGAGWFSTAYGSFRSFAGRNAEIMGNDAKSWAHHSLFKEDFALINSLEWLINLKHKHYENGSEILDWIKRFINKGELLQNNTQISEVTSDGVSLKDSYGNIISIFRMSDGYRSILSLVLDLLYRLVSTYDEDLVFKNIQNGGTTIDVPGVVLIDEIDAHLHPTWQTKIGTWFTTYFPNIQFIVTTHSPLVCRSAIKGSIWELEHSEDGVIGHQITGIDYNRLVYGNVLDALGTTVFGKNIGRSESSNKMLKELAILNMRQQQGDLSEEDQTQLNKLRQIFMTDVADNFLND